MAYMELKKRGMHTVYSSTAVVKIASIKSIEKVGGKRIGQLLYQNVFRSKQLCLIKNSVKEVLEFEKRKIFTEAKGNFKLQAKNNEKYYFLIKASNFYPG
jgi:hypothetical protein